jgi:hypothetical protein
MQLLIIIYKFMVKKTQGLYKWRYLNIAIAQNIFRILLEAR